jgi:hypothetical protein
MGLLLRDELSRVVSRTPSECFQTLIQSKNVGVWWRGVTSRLEGPAPWVAGSTIFFQNRLRAPQWVTEIKEIIPDQLIEAYYTDGDFRGAESWEFEPVGSGARVVHRWLGLEAVTYTGRALKFSLGKQLHSYLFSGALDGLAK